MAIQLVGQVSKKFNQLNNSDTTSKMAVHDFFSTFLIDFVPLKVGFC